MTYVKRYEALVAAFMAAALLGAAGCAGGDQAREAEQAFRRSFRVAFERYQRYEPSKALVLAHGDGGQWAYGYARDQNGQMQAINAAKQRCRRERARYGVEAPCRTYAIGDEITGDPALVEEVRSE
jgi:hypothetical protein